MHAAVRSPLGKTWSRDDDRAREDERERKPRGWTGYRERIIKTNGIIVKINLLKNFIKCGEENEIEFKRVREREKERMESGNILNSKQDSHLQMTSRCVNIGVSCGHCVQEVFYCNRLQPAPHFVHAGVLLLIHRPHPSPLPLPLKLPPSTIFTQL